MDWVLQRWSVISVIAAILVVGVQRKRRRHGIDSSVNPAIERPKQIDPSRLVGLEQRVESVMTKLKEAPVLSIVGMGGIGKTTLAMVVYDTIERSFEYTCFLRDVKVVIGKNTDRDYIQAQIIEKMSYKGRKVDETFKWEMLKERKVLIVLDDVESESQVLGIRDFSDDSRIIVTTRNSGIFTEEKSECHFVELKELDVEDSETLFCLHAFEKEKAHSNYKGHVVKFVEICGRLPLALTVVAKYLYHVDKKTWVEVLEKLMQAKAINGSKDAGLWSILKTVCYDFLPRKEKQMFVEVATFFHNEDVEKLKQAWSVCDSASPHPGLMNLVNRGLVTIEKSSSGSSSQECSRIRMHEHLRELGRSMSCLDTEYVADPGDEGDQGEDGKKMAEDGTR